MARLIVCVTGMLLSAASTTWADSITLTGTVRDFLATGTAAGVYNGHLGAGHRDFQYTIANDPDIVTGTLGLDGKPVYAGGLGGTVTTHSQAEFDQWFRDTAGVNTSFSHTITLNDIGGGIYSFADSNFFPADGKGFNDSLCCNHNYSFTYELATIFTYQPGQAFTFTGDDDVFVYINNQRVINLGGVHGAQTASVNLDTLGLTAGNNYGLNVFFAERHTTGSSFRIDTSIASLQTPPTGVPEPSSMLLLGIGLAGLGWRSRIARRTVR